MNWIEILEELIKFVLPSAVIFGVCYTIITRFFEQENRRRQAELRIKNDAIVIPIRLQAYERLTLLLERISPNNLLLRMNRPGVPAAEFKMDLISEINNEFSHNLSQQVYVSSQSWSLVRAVKEQVINLINTTYINLPADAKSIDLSKAIFERMIKDQEVPTQKALDFLRKEVHLIFE